MAQQRSPFSLLPGSSDAEPAVPPPPAAADPAAAAPDPAADQQTTQPQYRRSRAVRPRGDNRRAAKPAIADAAAAPASTGPVTTVSILAGPLDATATAAAYDLSVVLDDGAKFRVVPIIGKGGAQTLRDLKSMRDVDLGIVGTDELARLRRSGELAKIASDLVYVTKLFNEEVHVLTRADSGITELAQLAQRRVAVGPAGADASAHELFQRLDIKPIEVNLTTADAIEKLKSGDVAAAVVVDGKPASAIRVLPAGFRLIPVPYTAELQEDFLPGELAAADYPGLIDANGTVQTVSVGAVLVATRAWRGSERYKHIAAFVQALFPRIADFQTAPRLAKWKEINIAAVVPDVPRFAPAQDWLKQNANSEPDQRRNLEQLRTSAQAATGGAPADAERDRLFQEFLRWNQARQRNGGNGDARAR